MEARTARPLAWAGHNAGVALAYLVTAVAALSVADPAAPAAAVFPSAGLALAALLVWGSRLLPGIALSALVTNLYMLRGLDIAPWLLGLGALGITAGSVLQAWVGARLCEQYARAPLPAGSGWNEFRVMLLGGPLACAFASAVGNLVHFGLGRLTLGEVPWNLWTWWVGDSLGVALFTPLLLPGLQLIDRRPWQWWRALLPPLVALVVVMLAYTLVSLREQARIEAVFHEQARTQVERLNVRIAGHSETLRSIRRFWQSSDAVDHREFNKFVVEALQQQPDIRLLGWAPVRDGRPRLGFAEPGSYRGLEGAPIDDAPALRDAVAAARDSGHLVAMRGTGFLQDERLRGSKVILEPIYANGPQQIDVLSRRATFLGVAVMAFELLPQAGPGGGLLLRIEDRAGPNPILLHDSGGDAGHEPLELTTQLPIGERQWTVVIRSPAGYRLQHRSPEAALVLTALLFLASLLLALVLALRRSQSWQLQSEQAERARRQAEREAQMKGAFLATMSHEIRTPMNGVIGMTQLLADTRLDTEQQHYVSTIRRSCEALLRILNDILDYSKIEAGRLQIEAGSLDLRELMEECCSLFSPHSRQSGIPLALDMDERVPARVIGDPLRIRQVLINLLGNAFKFTRQGRITLRLLALPPRADGVPRVRFEVQDTGIGIADVQRARLFESFSQGDSSITRKYGGTGLGLSICRLLVQLMGGEIGVQTVYGQGSMFWFILPLPVAEAAPASGATASAADEAAATPREPAAAAPRVLVAEDNPVNQQVIAGFLRRQGILPRLVGDGVEALHVLTNEREDFDLVFMDCEMPNMDGYTATERIRQWERAEQRPPLFICGVSAHVMQEYRDMALTAGMNDFIAKPLQRVEIERVLAGLRRQLPRPEAGISG